MEIGPDSGCQAVRTGFPFTCACRIISPNKPLNLTKTQNVTKKLNWGRKVSVSDKATSWGDGVY